MIDEIVRLENIAKFAVNMNGIYHYPTYFYVSFIRFANISM